MDGFHDSDKEKNVRKKRNDRFKSERDIRSLRRKMKSVDKIDESDLREMRKNVRLTTRMIFEAVSWMDGQEVETTLL